MARKKKPTNPNMDLDEQANKRSDVLKPPTTARGKAVRSTRSDRPTSRTDRPDRGTRGKVLSGQSPADETSSEVEDDDMIEKEETESEEPNPAVVGEDWTDLTLEDTLETIGPSMVALELSEDPVRLYLKEIGQINLLDADS